MALISCPECKVEISSSAVVCHNCGNPVQKVLTPGEGHKLYLEPDKSMTRFSRLLMGVTAVLGGGMLIIHLQQPHLSAEAEQAAKKKRVLDCHKDGNRKNADAQRIADKPACPKLESGYMDTHSESPLAV